MNVYDRLKSSGIELPSVTVPDAKFEPYVISDKLITLSGHIPKIDGQLVVGKLGDDMTTEQGAKIARLVAIDLIGTLQGALSDLGKVKRIVNINCMVNGTLNFTEPHVVANACSQLMHDVFGEAGKHSRNAYTVAQLPFGVCVEIALIAEIY